MEEVRHVARLARLQLSDSELAEFQGELNALLGHFQDIQDIDADGVETRPHAVALQNVWAEDEPGQCLTRDEAMRNAPASKAGVFIVPTIIEE